MFNDQRTNRHTRFTFNYNVNFVNSISVVFYVLKIFIVFLLDVRMFLLFQGCKWNKNKPTAKIVSNARCSVSNSNCLDSVWAYCVRNKNYCTTLMRWEFSPFTNENSISYNHNIWIFYFGLKLENDYSFEVLYIYFNVECAVLIYKWAYFNTASMPGLTELSTQCFHICTYT